MKDDFRTQQCKILITKEGGEGREGKGREGKGREGKGRRGGRGGEVGREIE